MAKRKLSKSLDEAARHLANAAAILHAVSRKTQGAEREGLLSLYLTISGAVDVVDNLTSMYYDAGD